MTPPISRRGPPPPRRARSVPERWTLPHVMDRLEEAPLAEARPRIAEIIERNVRRHPEREVGYTAVAHTMISARSHRMRLRVYSWFGAVWLSAGDEMVPSDPAVVTYPLFRASLLAINSIWEQQWACAQAFRSRTLKVPTGTGGGYSLKRLPMIPIDPTFPESILHIPWFAIPFRPACCRRQVAIGHQN